MSFGQYLLPLVLCSLCMPGRIVYATPALKEELECNPGTRCNCSGSNLTMMSCNVSNGLFTLPIDLSPRLRNVKIVGRNFSIQISKSDYGNSWQTIENLEIFGDDADGQLQLLKTFTDKLIRTKLFRIRNAGLRSIDMQAFSSMKALEHLDLSNNVFLTFYQVRAGLNGFRSRTLEIFNISGIHSGERMTMFSMYTSFSSPFLDSSLSSVRHLDISWTRVSSSQVSFELLPNLVTLNVSGTLLFQRFGCTQLQNLEELHMDYWPIMPTSSRRPRGIFGDLYNFIEMSALIYGCRNVSHFLNGCYHLPPRLKRLHLMHSEAAEFIIDFRKDICINSDLEYLNLKNLRITKPIGTITGLHSLRSLDVSDTGIPFSLRLFHDMKSLEDVNASGNRLNEVENVTDFNKLFNFNNNLKRVDLSQNGMTVIPYNMFNKNGHLERIDLSNNKLKYLKLNLRSCRSLRQLSLTDNRFKEIDGVVDISLQFVITDNNSLAVSEIVKETGISCKCANDDTRTLIPGTKMSDNNNCAGAVLNRNDSKADTEAYSINCSSGMLGVVAPIYKSKSRTSTFPLTIGIVIPVCALAVIIITAAVIRKKRQNRNINGGETYVLHEQIVLQEIDHEIIADIEPVQPFPDLINLQEIDHETIEDIEPVWPVQDQIVLQGIDHEPIADVEPARPVPDQIDLQEIDHENVAETEPARPVPDQIVLQEIDDKTTTDVEPAQTVPDQIFYIGLSEASFSANNRKPIFAAFLAYSHVDRDFVIDKLYYPLQKLLPELLPDWDEELFTVLYDKHFLPGQCTMDVCEVAVYNSYVTVPIISDAFSRSTYCHHEIELAIEARAPIVPVYVPGVHTDRFPAVIRYIYNNNVRVIWPDMNKSETPSNEEISVVRDIAFSIATYVKHARNIA